MSLSRFAYIINLKFFNQIIYLYNFDKNKGKFHLFNHADTPDRFVSYFAVSSDSNLTLNETNIKNHLKAQTKLSWQTFDDLIKCQTSLWEVHVAEDGDENNWQERKLICNCPFYMKNNLCKHSLALAATLKFVSFPDEAKSLPLEQKAKRGRRSLAKRALLTQ